jgi:hypothetical protein
MITEESSQRSLWTWLQDTSHLRCADARDKVYALLSVATKGHEGIEPDYEMALQDLLDSVLHRHLKTAQVSGAGELNEYCMELKTLFGSVLSDLVFWETMPKRMRPRLA